MSSNTYHPHSRTESSGRCDLSATTHHHNSETGDYLRSRPSALLEDGGVDPSGSTYDSGTNHTSQDVANVGMDSLRTFEPQNYQQYDESQDSSLGAANDFHGPPAGGPEGPFQGLHGEQLPFFGTGDDTAHWLNQLSGVIAAGQSIFMNGASATVPTVS